MSQLFREVKADDGTVTYEVIEVADIPDETIRKHDAFKGVLAESVARRQTIADLKQASEKSSDDDDVVITEDKTKEKEEVVVPPVVPVYDSEKEYQSFKKRLADESQAEKKVLTDREVMVARIADDNNINIALLRGGTEAELTEHAQLLAKENLKFSDLGANASSSPPPISDVISGTNKRFGWDDKDDDFNF